MSATDIFIRSYKRDFPWLEYSVKLIKKYCSGFRNIIIVAPENDFRELRLKMSTSGAILHACPNYKNDYLGQQVTKLQAHKYSDADRILFVDSDVMFTAPTTPEYFMAGDAIWLYKTPYREELLGQAMCWKPITETAVRFNVDWEYMRRFPLMYWRSTLVNLEEYMGDVGQYIINQPANSFSEFNVLGAYAEMFEADKYKFIDTTCNDIVAPIATQYWSWGGISTKLKKELDEAVR